jgi:hypothetical protein
MRGGVMTRFPEIERGTPVWRPHPRFRRVQGIVLKVNRDGCAIRFGCWTDQNRVVTWDETLPWSGFDIDFFEAGREQRASN